MAMMATKYPAPAPTYIGPPSKFHDLNNKPIDRIVLHGTVSACVEGGARATARYFMSEAAQGSAHYVVDPGEVIQSAYDSVDCWHAPPSKHSLGIELCDWVGVPPLRNKPLPLERWNEPNHQAMLIRAAVLTAQLCLAYNVPMVLLSPADVRAGKRGICEHSDVSEAFHQSSHWDLGEFPRLAFIKLVRKEAQRIIDATTAEPPKDVHPTRVTKARELITEALRRADDKKRRDQLRKALKEMPQR